jgi:hypothetical protein
MRVLLKESHCIFQCNQLRLTGDRVVGRFVGERVGFLGIFVGLDEVDRV